MKYTQNGLDPRLTPSHTVALSCLCLCHRSSTALLEVYGDRNTRPGTALFREYVSACASLCLLMTVPSVVSL